jgi:hypothetical protein
MTWRALPDRPYTTETAAAAMQSRVAASEAAVADAISAAEHEIAAGPG